MESLEQALKSYILSKYRSLREFAGVARMPYSTVDSIFKRGLSNPTNNTTTIISTHTVCL